MQVGIVGGSGYGGGELLRLLTGHPVARLRVVAGRSAVGAAVGQVFAHLAGSAVADVRISAVDVDELAACDVVLLATPHGVSLDLAPALVTAGARVVDLSGAFRLDPDVFATWYGMPHTAPDLSPATYGLPELHRDAIAGADLVANPGCYPTAALLALAPLAGLVDPGGVVVTGLSGTSGAGKGLREDLHSSHATANVVVYGTPGHRHTPEIEAGWAAVAGGDVVVPLTFTPHLVPMARGEVVTVVAPLIGEVDPSTVRAAFAEACADEPYLHLVAEGTWPASTHTIGGNAAHLGVVVDPRTRRVTAVCALDNLVKGAAGQALQNANLMCGVAETAGVPVAGVYP